MKLPTVEALRAAQESIRREYPLAPATLELWMLCLKEPLMRGIVDEIAAATGADADVLMRAFVAGLNLGLRVSNAR